MIAINAHEAKDILFDIVVGCSVAHSFLPPWDFLNDFPQAQKVYKAFIYLIGYVAINARSTVYKSISTETPGGVNGDPIPTVKH
jgi:hypothetical protein